MRFTPHTTVATVIENQGQFLMVEELKDNQPVINQPAGHLEPNETLIEAALRETMEETAWQVELTGIIGIYLFTGANGINYQRTCFAAKATKHHPENSLDEGIIQALWLTKEQLIARQKQWRTPIIMDCINDYLAGHIYPLSIIRC